MSLVCYLGGKEIVVDNEGAFKRKANITINLIDNKDLTCEEIIGLFKNNNLSTLTFYDKIDGELKFHEEFSGYSFLTTYVVNLDVNTISITLSKTNIMDTTKDEIVQDVNKEVAKVNYLDQMQYAFSVMTVALDDEQALNCVDLFPPYEVGKLYLEGDRFKYNERLYKVLQEHTSQDDWRPDEVKSLYLNIADPEIEFPDFVHPTGSHDSYSIGDKVTFKGNHYVSKIDNNVYSPEEYPDGWELVE